MGEVVLRFEMLRGRPDRRRQSEVGREGLRSLLQRATGIPGLEWRIRPDGAGRLFAFDPQGNRGPDLSLAHSGAWVACALVGQGRIGVDIEVPRPGRDFQGLAEAYFSPEERLVIAKDGEAALLGFWTLREAIGKALGSGLAGALAVDGQALAPAWGKAAEILLDGRRWFVAQKERPQFTVALAWLAPEAVSRADGLGALEAALDGCANIHAAT